MVEKVFEYKMGLERSFLTARGSNIKIVAYLNEKIEKSNFENAIKRLAEIHPFLRAEIQIRQDGTGIFSTEKERFPKTVTYTSEEEISVKETIDREDSQPSNWEKDPTSRFILIQKKEGGSVIIAYIHHSIADGRSVVFLMNHLLSIIADPTVKRETIAPVSLSAAAPHEAQISNLMKSMVSLINKKWAKEKQIFPAEEYSRITEQYYQKGSDLYLLGQLSSEETSYLRNQAKLHGISLNSLLLTAAIWAKNEVPSLKNLPIEVGFAVDLRNRLTQTAGESCSLLASAVKIKPLRNSNGDMWNYAQDIQSKSIKALKSNKKLFRRLMMSTLMDPTFSDALYMAQRGGWTGTPFIQKLLKKGKKLPVGIVITNLGGLQLPQNFHGSNPLTLQDAIFYPPLAMKEIVELGIASLGGKLSIVIPARSPEYDRVERQLYLDTMLNYLRTLIKEK